VSQSVLDIDICRVTPRPSSSGASSIVRLEQSPQSAEHPGPCCPHLLNELPAPLSWASLHLGNVSTCWQIFERDPRSWVFKLL
jgi:hypothetical protein